MQVVNHCGIPKDAMITENMTNDNTIVKCKVSPNVQNNHEQLMNIAAIYMCLVGVCWISLELKTFLQSCATLYDKYPTKFAYKNFTSISLTRQKILL